jgi:CRISPR-associated protein Csm2
MDVKQVMTEDASGAGMVEFAHTTAVQLVKENLTRSQLRNIFTEVRKIEALWASKPDEALRRLNILKPKLYYAAARSTPVTRLRDVLTPAIDQVNAAQDDVEQEKRFRRFIQLFEAILAYHRSEGGRN